MRLIACLVMAALLIGQSGNAEDIPPEQAEAILREVLQSHIDGNIPAAEDFDRLMKRDLSAFFSGPEEDRPSVGYEMLREGPTQTGISYPKYYVWVKVEGSYPREGAARVAAIDRERFEVLQYLGKDEIAEDPKQLDRIFPPAVALAILQRIQSPKALPRTPHN